MSLEVLIPCVGYADFLAITLPQTRRLFENITVLTSPNDNETLEVAHANGIRLHQTNAWYKGSSPFNKAAALNERLSILSSPSFEGWILFLDADIFLPEITLSPVDSLDRRCLYSVVRRMCETQAEWEAYSTGRVGLASFPLNIPPVINGKVWRHRPTSNPAALSGYFQLSYFGFSTLQCLPESPTAAEYDVEFALTFPEHLRRYIPNIEALHLGPVRTNWSGRISPSWKRKGLNGHI